MKNVYDEVQRFYDQEIIDDIPVTRDWVEGFLRQKAWQGADDDELRDVWQNLKMLVLYLDSTGTEYLEEISYNEYSSMIQWLVGHVKGFKATLKPVRRFFNVLLEFYRYLALKKLVADTTELETAAKEIAGGKKIKLDLDRTLTMGKNAGALSEEMDSIIGEIIESLMLKLGSFFKGKNSMMIFSGRCFYSPGRSTPFLNRNPVN